MVGRFPGRLEGLGSDRSARPRGASGCPTSALEVPVHKYTPRGVWLLEDPLELHLSVRDRPYGNRGKDKEGAGPDGLEGAVVDAQGGDGIVVLFPIVEVVKLGGKRVAPAAPVVEHGLPLVTEVYLLLENGSKGPLVGEGVVRNIGVQAIQAVESGDRGRDTDTHDPCITRIHCQGYLNLRKKLPPHELAEGHDRSRAKILDRHRDRAK